jgi:ectoine hydroxylase-related dioxygenase (phytanoyl-CoA dioxygenase family)
VLPKGEMRPLFFDSDIATEAEMKTAAQMCVPANFISIPAAIGSIMAFLCSVCHHGPKNRDSKDRVALYMLLSPSDAPKQDDEQRLPLGAPGGYKKSEAY